MDWQPKQANNDDQHQPGAALVIGKVWHYKIALIGT